MICPHCSKWSSTKPELISTDDGYKCPNCFRIFRTYQEAQGRSEWINPDNKLYRSSAFTQTLMHSASIGGIEPGTIFRLEPGEELERIE